MLTLGSEEGSGLESDSGEEGEESEEEEEDEAEETSSDEEDALEKLKKRFGKKTEVVSACTVFSWLDNMYPHLP